MSEDISSDKNKWRQFAGKFSRQCSNLIDENFRYLNAINNTVIIVAASTIIFRFSPLFRRYRNLAEVPERYFKQQKKLRLLLLSTQQNQNHSCLRVAHMPWISYIMPLRINRWLFQKSDLYIRPFGVYTHSSLEFIDRDAYLAGKVLYAEDKVLVSHVSILKKGSNFKSNLAEDILRLSLGEVNLEERPTASYSSDLNDIRKLNDYLDMLEKIESRKDD